MDNGTLFHPMTELPIADESDTTFSKTVIIYGERQDFVELGYYDFEEGAWSHFGKNTFLLKCWCYLPEPLGAIKNTQWEALPPKGYKANVFER
jgi:hypothetical protein